MIKLFASDMDGTFLNENHEADKESIEFIQDIHQKSYHFAVATGRNIVGVKRIFGMWDTNAYLVMLNGALILDPKRNVIFEKQVDPEFMRKIYNRYPNKFFQWVGKNKIYTTFSKEEVIENNKKQRNMSDEDIKRNQVFIDEFLSQFEFEMTIKEILKKPILKINLEENNQEEYKNIQKFIDENSHLVVNAPFEENHFEITDQTIDKAQGVRQLADLLGIGYDQVAVFGDGGNDVTMLRDFKYSYAMENACEDAKKAASSIIGHCKDRAVHKKIKEVIERQTKLNLI